MKKLMASALAAAMVVSLAGCGGSKSATTGETSASATSETASSTSVLNTDTSTLYINLASEPDRLDPALNSTVDGAVLAVNSFVGLMTYDENGQLAPGVAESYDVSEDGMTYTFHLRQSKWSDGTDLTAKDFVYSWNRAANPMTASDYSYLFDGLIAKNEAAEEMVPNPEYDAAAAEAAAAAGTEPGFLFQQNTMRDALVAAINLNIFNNHCDTVVMANIAQMVNVLQAMVLTDGDKLLLTPTYHVFRMYRDHQNARQLETYAETRLLGSAEEPVPDLHVSASEQADGTLLVTAVNLSDTDACSAEVLLSGRKAKAVTAEVLTGAPAARNTFAAPDAVHPVKLEARCTDTGFAAQLPPCSVTAFRVTTE